ncbi:unnamed protein product [Toxocara canis]|uniref:Transposase n=1 Tax=Toxocara canis TaxID=6265 RepID=A0A183UVR9_TOXCA|nr:unnamed protein product [Toxocara canis]
MVVETTKGSLPWRRVKGDSLWTEPALRYDGTHMWGRKGFLPVAIMTRISRQIRQTTKPKGKLGKRDG